MEVKGGCLYQWDTSRYMSVLDAPAGEDSFVGYATCDMTEALRVAVEDNQARIPDEMLQTGADVACWLEYNGRTWSRALLHPIRRKKPSGYVTTPTEAETYDTMREWVKEQIELAMADVPTLPITVSEVDGMF